MLRIPPHAVLCELDWLSEEGERGDSGQKPESVSTIVCADERMRRAGVLVDPCLSLAVAVGVCGANRLTLR